MEDVELADMKQPDRKNKDSNNQLKKRAARTKDEIEYATNW